MLIRRAYSFKPNSKWKLISLGEDCFLVNGSNTKQYIKIIKRMRCLDEIPCEDNVEDLEIFTIEDGFIFNFFDDIYEIKEADEIDFLNLADFDYNKDDVLLLAIHKNRLSFITFWNDSKSDAETFQELSTIDFDLIPSATNLYDFIDRLVYIGNSFYYKNEDKDMLLVRFNSERIDTYSVPDYAKFFIDNRFDKYLYVRFDNSLIDIIDFKLYDISEVLNKYGNSLDDFGLTIFRLQDPSMDFIFWYEQKDVYSPELITSKSHTTVRGLLYCYSLKQFVFSDLPTLSESKFQTFLLYDYTVPNIVKSNNGYTLFYIDNALNFEYLKLNSSINILVNLDCNKNGDYWHRVIFTNISRSKNLEKKQTIIINNSLFLTSIVDYSTLGQIIHMDNEVDAIRFIISKRFDRAFATKVLIPHLNNKIVHYLFVDDCCTIETPLSKYGKYTLLVPRVGEKLDFDISFNSFKKFVLERRINGNAWYDHLVLKCQYDSSQSEKTTYIDVTNLEIVSLDDLVDDAFNFE